MMISSNMSKVEFHMYQFLVLVFHFESGGDAIPRVKECFPLGMLH